MNFWKIRHTQAVPGSSFHNPYKRTLRKLQECHDSREVKRPWRPWVNWPYFSKPQTKDIPGKFLNLRGHRNRRCKSRLIIKGFKPVFVLALVGQKYSRGDIERGKKDKGTQNKDRLCASQLYIIRDKLDQFSQPIFHYHLPKESF